MSSHHKNRRLFAITCLFISGLVSFAIASRTAPIDIHPKKNEVLSSRSFEPIKSNVNAFSLDNKGEQSQSLLEEKIDAITAQVINPEPLKTSQMIWIPMQIAQQFHWNVGSMGSTFTLSVGAQQALDIHGSEKIALETCINDFLKEIRKVEKSKAETIESSPEFMKIHIPKGIDFQPQISSFNASVSQILGSSRAELLMPKVNEELNRITPLLAGEEWVISVRLSGNNYVAVETKRPNGSGISGSGSSSLPEYLEHLILIKEPTN